MRIKQLLGLAILLFMSSAIFAQQVRHIDKIMATVNEDVITERDYNDMKNSIVQTIPKGYTPSENELKAKVLSQLIENKLILQYGKKNMISVSDDEVMFFIAQSAQAQNMTVDEFYKRIAKEGISKKMLNKTVAESLVIEKVKSQYLNTSEKVTEEEIKHFIETQELATISQYEVQHIFLVANEANDVEIEKKIRKIHQQLVKGAKFNTLVKQYSEDPNSVDKNGDMGWVSQGVMSDDFDTILQNLKIGQVSEPLRSDRGWHILKVKNKREGKLSDDEKPIAAARIIADHKQQQSYLQWLEHLQSSAYIKVN